MQNPPCGDEVIDENDEVIDSSYFWQEGCGAFALHLARQLIDHGTPAELVVLSDTQGEALGEGIDYEVTHVAVRTADGFIDVNGLEADPRMLMEKFTPVDFTLKGPWDPDAFEARFMGEDDKPLYAADPQTEMQINCLLKANPEIYQMPSAAPHCRM